MNSPYAVHVTFQTASSFKLDSRLSLQDAARAALEILNLLY